MGRLEDLRTSLLDMDAEEVREKIRHIREDRKLVKHVANAPRAKREAKGKSLLASLVNMTPDQKAQLLKDLAKIR